MAKRTLSDMDKARALAESCRHTMYCDEGQSKLAHALKLIDSQLSELEHQRAELVDFTRAVIRYAGNNCDDYLADKAREALAKGGAA